MGPPVMEPPVQVQPAEAAWAGGDQSSRLRLQLRREHHRRPAVVDRPAVELIVVPRSAEIQAVEDALSLALVAMIGGTRPSVTPVMVRDHLRSHFQIDDAAMSVLRHIVHFSPWDDLERVLRTPPPKGSPPFMLTWRRWTRLSRATVAAFTYKVLVGIKGVPAHALSAEVAQQLLRSSYAQVAHPTPMEWMKTTLVSSLSWHGAFTRSSSLAEATRHPRASGTA